MMVVLRDYSGREPTLSESALRELRRLGVTSVGLVRDRQTFGFVLEGWAFQPSRCADAAVAAVGRNGNARALHPLVQMAVVPAPQKEV